MNTNHDLSPYAPPSATVAIDETEFQIESAKSISNLLVALIYVLTALYLF